MTTKFSLSLHTTTTKLELAIAKFDQSLEQNLDDQINRNSQTYTIHKQQSWELGRELSVQLHDCLNMFVDGILWTDFAFLAIATGLGSFTGTRIGIVVARTLGEQLDIPVYGIDCESITTRAQQSEPPLSLGESLLAIAQEQWRSGIPAPWQAIQPIYEA